MIFEYKNAVEVVSDVTDEVPVLRVSGTLDLATIDTLRTELAVLLDKGPRDLVLDLSDVDFLSSVGIQLLVETHRKFGSGRFVIAAQDRSVLRPLTLTNLDVLLRIVPTVTDAHQAIRLAVD